MRAATVFKLLTLLALLGVGVALGFNVALFAKNRAAIQANTELNCRIGAFLVGTPITQQPEQSDQAFRHVVHKATSFLRALKSADCTEVKGASITTEQIQKQLHHLRGAVPKGGGHSGAPPGSSPPGGGHHPAPPSPPPKPGPRPSPPPPGDGNPPPKPPPDHCDVEVNPLLCVDVPPIPPFN